MPKKEKGHKKATKGDDKGDDKKHSKQHGKAASGPVVPFDPNDLSKPIPNSQRIYCRWRDDLFHECTVLDSKKIDEKTIPVVNNASAQRAIQQQAINAGAGADGAAAATPAASAAPAAAAAATAGGATPQLVLQTPIAVVGYPPIYYTHTLDPVHPYVYYVHYPEFNRRMDEWVPRERVSFTAPASAQHSAASMAAAASHAASTAAASGSSSAADAAAGAGAGKGGIDVDGGGGKGGKGGKDGGGRKRKMTGKDGGKGGIPSGGNSHPPSGGNYHGPSNAGNEHSGAGYDAASLHAHEEFTKVKNVNHIVLGKYEMETWYYSPFPEEYHKFSTLYFCEFCLKFYGYESELKRHQLRCQLRHPPGNEIYRSDETNVTIAMFEVDGAKETIYCQNICYIAKLFLDHKTLQYDTTPFLFYVLCEVDARGCHMVGYFSKEKLSEDKYNLACILTLPCHQRKGYGKFLISFSYELSKIEEKIGSPEKPLSDLGLVSYRSYWAAVLLDVLAARPANEEVSIEQLSRVTCITTADVIDTLQYLKVIKYHKGEHLIVLNSAVLAEHQKQTLKNNAPPPNAKPGAIFVRSCLPDKLRWTPYILSIKKQRTHL